MGQGLSNIEAWQLKWNTPQSISKYTERQENVRIKYALSSMQGLCPYMEDAHAAIPDLDGARTTSFFGVYDGHGGANVAKYCAEKVHTELLLDEGYPNDLGNALGRVFSRIDVQLKEYDEWRALANPPSNQSAKLPPDSCLCSVRLGIRVRLIPWDGGSMI
nr:probable protein phosphatase 2C 16 isoform X3 [Lolium perenne]